VTVYERPRFEYGRVAARWLVLGRTRVGANGSFAVGVRPALNTEYRATLTPASSYRSNTAAAFIQPRVRFTVDRSTIRVGSVSVFRGRVRPSPRDVARIARIPAGPKQVTIEIYNPAKRRWVPVDLVNTDRLGRIVVRNRWSFLRPTTKTIRIRMVVTPERAWPFAPAASRALVLRVLR
jgi:endonuclease YncB( thermonuclease family)